MTAIGYVSKQNDGRYKGPLRTVTIQAKSKSCQTQKISRRPTRLPGYDPRHRDRCGLDEEGRNLRQGICEPLHRRP